ncbi:MULTISPECIES: YjgN family protein [unclassified Agarivorans]|uniref:YjgN family protein n=1 Tax=unclassified Agarivorans TaxID=2636026 RepID=UPI003D7C3760
MESQQQPRHQFTFLGRAGEYFGIWIVNILLTVITLGIYSAWAKVRNKQYFYGNTELAGESFEYLAKPIQILIGRIIAVILVLGWLTLPSFHPTIGGLMVLLFVLATPVLVVRNLRFDARMTRYRNVRFDFVGSYGRAYMVLLVLPLLYFVGFAIAAGGLTFLAQMSSPWILGIISIVACGLGLTFIYALITSQMSQFILNGYRWGQQQFGAEIGTGRIFKIYLKTAAIGLSGLLVIVAIGVAIFVGSIGIDFSQLGGLIQQLNPENLESDLGVHYGLFGAILAIYISMFLLGWFVSAYLKACLRNYQFGETVLADKLQLNSTVKPWAFLALLLSNLLLTVFSLGLALPLVKVRYARFMANATAIDGDIDQLTTHNQVDDGNVAIADEVADAFSIEIGVI